ncbi:MAG: adenosine deaminase [Pararhodobacter sp.]
MRKPANHDQPPLIDPALPKIELHLHIEGAAPPAFIRGLAREKKLDIDGIFSVEGAYAYHDFWDFLKVYEAACTTLQTPRDFARLTAAVLEQSARDGVIYTEVFISPDFCGGGDPGAWREYLHAIEEAATEARRAHGIEMRGIVTCVRHFGAEKARASARCAAETAGPFVTGFGMGGDEKFGQPADFAWAFDCAREAGLRLTSHAGEWGGPESVRDTLDALKVERIGHGVRAIEDPALVAELAERGVVLEVCPGSNVALGLYARFSDHPVARLRERGIKLTLSTDDPPFFHSTNVREYEALAHAFGWTAADFLAINADAARAAFCDDATRRALLSRLESAA